MAWDAPAAGVRSRPDPAAVCDATPMDAVLPRGNRKKGHPAGPQQMGLQAPGAGDASDTAVAHAAVGEVHRDGAAVPAESAVPDVPASGSRPATCHALVQPHGPAGLAL